MNDGKHCPGCGKDIGIWPVLSATWPDRIRCPHCKAQLSYQDSSGLLAALITLMIVFAVGLHYAILRIGLPAGWHQAAVFVLALSGLWVLIELTTTAYLRNKKVLISSDAE